MSGKKFQFSLASVLKLRMHETECARQELSKLIEQRDQQDHVAQQLRRDLLEVVQSRATGATGQRALSRHEAFRSQAQQRFDDAIRVLKHLNEKVNEARLRLVERKTAEEALKQLRDDERAKSLQEHKAAETQFLDEQAISSFQRQRRAANT